LGALIGGSSGFVYGAITRCGRPFHAGSTTRELCNSLERRQPHLSGPTTPTWQRLPALPPCGFRLCPFRSPLLGASLLFSLPRGNEMFQFPRFPSTVLCVQTVMVRHDPHQVFPFGDPRIGACLAAPRGLSQPATSFIGFQRQGIHRVPFTTCRDDARARYGVLKERRTWSRRLHGGRSHRRFACPRPSKLHSVPTRPANCVRAGHDCAEALPPRTRTSFERVISQ
jgi:hypothetical protein